MINGKVVENIRQYGVYKDSGEGRRRVLTQNVGFKMNEKAEYVIIGGCLQPESMPHVFRALKIVFEHLKVDYTFLSKEQNQSFSSVQPTSPITAILRMPLNWKSSPIPNFWTVTLDQSPR